MSDLAASPHTLAPRPLTIRYQGIVNAVFALFIFFGMFSLIEPSPYDFLAVITIPLWFIGGFKVHRSLIPVLALWTVFEAAGFYSLMPYWDEYFPRMYQLQSLYLFVTTIFFTIFFSERTMERASICLKAFTLGCILSSIAGIIGYLDIAHLGSLFTADEGRVSATFKDPNVYGSYLILAVCYLLQLLLFGMTRRTIVTLLSLLLILVGVFVSYSRGSWGGALAAMLLTIATGFLTAETSQLRIRVVKMTSIAALIGLVTLGGMLSVPSVRNFFLMRAEVSQDYDEGPTGRFGNQIRSLPMLVERFDGFGPLRFRLIFGLEPHNSYVGGFANDGWIGGFTWIGIVLCSIFVGFRLMLVRSPFRRLAQVFTPPMFALLMQGFQIDVDHWRQLFLCFGAVWGIEAARLRWLERRRLAPTAALPEPA